jgi:hypothetical protein
MRSLSNHAAPLGHRTTCLRFEELETREVPATLPSVPNFAAVGAASTPTLLAVAQQSDGGKVLVFDFQSQTERYVFTPFGSTYTGGVTVATGDVNADGTPDIICASGEGRITTLKIYDGNTGAKIAAFRPFGNNNTGGAFMATADFNSDGNADLVVGGGDHPTIKVFSGATLTAASPAMLARFTAFGSGFSAGYTGGVRVATGDITGDGTPDIAAATASGQAIIAGFDGTAISETTPFQPFSPYFATGTGSTGGGWVAVGDVNGDGFADVATGNGSGAAHVRIIDGKTLPNGGNPTLIRTVSLVDSSAATGAHALFADLNGDGTPELVESANTGASPTVAIYNATGGLLTAFDPFSSSFQGGVNVG